MSERRNNGWFAVLLLLSAGVHLAGLGYPREVVFDEVHFGKFVTAYCCTHERFFDIHPPHAKLLIAGVAYIGGYRGGLSFEHIGQPYGDVSPIPLRLFPALAGMVLPLMVYWLLRQLGAGGGAAFLGGMLALLDTALLVQTRIIALDGLLLVATFGCLAAYLVAERRLFAAGWLRWALLAGALAGLAAGTKFTGLVALGLLGVLLLLRLLPGESREQRGVPLRRWLQVAGTILGSALFIYAAGWAVHFVLLTEPGSGDAWRVPDLAAGFLPVSFVRETWELHRLMLTANRDLAATHPNASAWYTWPLMTEPVFYWQMSDAEPGKAGSIYFIGNPAIWWGGTFFFLIAAISTMLTWAGQLWEQRRFGIRAALSALAGIVRDPLFLLLTGFAAALIPLMEVHRVLFLYHYLTPLLFSLLVAVLWFERVGGIRRGGVAVQPAWYFAALLVAAIGFVVFSPLSYGLQLPIELHDRLFLFASWR